MMILPIADSLMNCMQNLTSRIAGIDNEQVTNRVIGAGTMLGYGIGAIKEQFNTSNTKINNNENNNLSKSGFKGFTSRVKEVISPTNNLSAEKDYNGNINPIRQVVAQNKNDNKVNIPTANTINTENKESKAKVAKNFVSKVAKGGMQATKSYIDIGSRMAEGNFDKSYISKGRKSNNIKNNFTNTKYINQIKEDRNNKNVGDENE